MSIIVNLRKSLSNDVEWEFVWKTWELLTKRKNTFKRCL